MSRDERSYIKAFLFCEISGVCWQRLPYASVTHLLFPDLHREGHYEMMAGVYPSVRLSVCRVPRPKLTIERPRKPKIGRMEAHHTGNPWTYLKVKRLRSRSPGRFMLPQTQHHNKCRSGHYNFLEIAFF